MYHFAGNYIFDGKKLIKNAFVSVNDEGEVLNVSVENAALKEIPRMSYHNGIIAPGFINAHCHLELSENKSNYIDSPGLAKFIGDIIDSRKNQKDLKRISLADRQMYENGISAVGDIVNTDASIDIKLKSKIYYKNFIELSGLDPKLAVNRYDIANNLVNLFNSRGLDSNISIHSFYSICKDLFDLVSQNKMTDVSSVHFLESSEEYDLVYSQKGKLFELMSSLMNDYFPICKEDSCFKDLIKRLPSKTVLLVHNVKIEKPANFLNENVVFCLCPNSNLILHNELPNKRFVSEIKDSFVVGTDSLSSNKTLCVLSELKCLEENYDFLKLEALLSAATSNGAKALGIDNKFGNIQIGKTPGLVLIENTDLVNMKLGKDADVKRLI